MMGQSEDNIDFYLAQIGETPKSFVFKNDFDPSLRGAGVHVSRSSENPEIYNVVVFLRDEMGQYEGLTLDRVRETFSVTFGVEMFDEIIDRFEAGLDPDLYPEYNCFLGVSSRGVYFFIMHAQSLGVNMPCLHRYLETGHFPAQAIPMAAYELN